MYSSLIFSDTVDRQLLPTMHHDSEFLISLILSDLITIPLFRVLSLLKGDKMRNRRFIAFVVKAINNFDCLGTKRIYRITSENR